MNYIFCWTKKKWQWNRCGNMFEFIVCNNNVEFIQVQTNVNNETELRILKNTIFELLICIVQLNGYDVIIKEVSVFFHLIAYCWCKGPPWSHISSGVPSINDLFSKCVKCWLEQDGSDVQQILDPCIVSSEDCCVLRALKLEEPELEQIL